MKKRILYFAMLVVTVGTACAQGSGYLLYHAQRCIKADDIDNAVRYYDQCVDKAKEARNAGKGVKGELLAEFAYALALHHDFEAALINIDRAMMLQASNGTFFADQILTIMGYEMAAFQLSGTLPKRHIVKGYSGWIDGLYDNLANKYATKVTINRDSPQEALRRASTLAERGQTVQAIVLYEELMEQYPSAYVIPASYSTLWEKRGNRVYAATLLKKSIELMGNADAAERAAYEVHLRKLEAVQPAGLSRLTQGMRAIVYTGASFGKDMSSLSGRVGVSTESKLSASLNANVMFWDKTAFGNIGFSAYKTWSFFVVGLGVSRQISKESKAWGLAPSVGLTFINKAQNASFDITAAGQIPFASETKFSYSLSVGTTFYIDFKREEK